MKQFKTKLNKFVVIFAFSSLVPLVSFAAGPATVNTGTASNFAILTKTGVTDVPTSIITGNVGSSPISGTATLLTCPEVTGIVYSDDTSGPLPCRVTDSTLLTTAVSDMQTAYTDAAGRTLPDATELGSGNIGGLTITPGLYKWSTNVTIPTDVTLSGGASDVWIFQIAGDLSISSAKSVILSGGAVTSNVFWQVGGPNGATIGTTATVNGTILSAKQIILQTGAVLNGRALSQTQVTLDHGTVLNSIYVPAPPVPVVVATSTPTSTPVLTPAPVYSSGSSGGSSSGSTTYGCKDPAASNYNYFTSSNPSLCVYSNTASSTVVVSNKIPAVATSGSHITSVPRLPNTGFAPKDGGLLYETLSAIGLWY